ncbi:hypothetical protein [Caenimonas sp. SL110]|uniref:hypothetical protein n=1 Tax=Caenimonas sp. SL110 TaxID=1450524 RepID=UPI000652DAD3|nr:hypothetical protein [Caenimonas sp. SL110]
MKRALFALVMALAAGCASKPPQPDWQMNAHSALERYIKAFMSGNARVEAAEFERARTELASTGDPGLVARAELTRCAARVATLVMEPCDGFEKLRVDAPVAERAYADFLAGRLAPADAALLPEQYRALATDANPGALPSIADPLSRLIAAGVLFRTGRADAVTLSTAADTAAHQGWRRALLSWLGVQAQRAEQAGRADEAGRIRRRMALVSGDR